MPARHFSSVLLPLPLRPAIPKNSPWRTSKEMSLQRLEGLVAGAPQRVQRALLERVRALLGHAEGLADRLGDDRRRGAA